MVDDSLAGGKAWVDWNVPPTCSCTDDLGDLGYYLDAVCYIRENFHHPIIWHKCNNIIILKTGMAQAIPAVLAPMGHAKDTTQVDCITITMHSLTIVLLHDPQIEE